MHGRWRLGWPTTPWMEPPSPWTSHWRLCWTLWRMMLLRLQRRNGRKTRRRRRNLLLLPRTLANGFQWTKWRAPTDSTLVGGFGSFDIIILFILLYSAVHVFYDDTKFLNCLIHHLFAQCMFCLWCFAFPHYRYHLRLENGTDGTRTLMPVRLIACLAGILDVGEGIVRLFWPLPPRLDFVGLGGCRPDTLELHCRESQEHATTINNSWTCSKNVA